MAVDIPIDFYLQSQSGQAIRLMPGRSYTLGRADDVDIVVPDTLLSRRHCTLSWDDQSFWSLTDLGSRNGTFVNERRITDVTQLLTGAQVRLGGHQFTVAMVPPGTDPARLMPATIGVQDTIEMPSSSDGEDEAERGAFSGRIGPGGVLDLLQFFKLTGRSGCLRLDDDAIWFCRGAPRDARHRDLVGRDAVFAIAAAAPDTFVFIDGEAPPAGERISDPPDNLFLDLALAQDNQGASAQDTADEASFFDESPIFADPVTATTPADYRRVRTEHDEGGMWAEVQTQVHTAPAPEPEPVAQDSTPSKATDILIGQRFGQARLEERLGQGSHAVVYRGHHAFLETDVAIKILLARPGHDDGTRRRRFMREAKAAHGIKHPNVITVHDAGETQDGQAYMVMDYVSGDNLGALLARHEASSGGDRGGPLGPAAVARLGHGIAAGLAAIHAADVVHRDIKPDNILLDADGQPRIGDLGMAHIDLATGEQALTGIGSTIGTPTYISPEAITDAGSVGPASDIYSLGITLYHLLAGHPPFLGASPQAVMRAHLRGDWVPLRKINPGVPARLATTIEACIAKDPAARPTAAQLVTRLEPLATEAVQRSDRLRAARGGQEAVHAFRPIPAATSRSGTVWLVGGVILVALVAAACWWFLTRP